MWASVRRELASLEWDAAPPVTPDVVADWTLTVGSLLAVRRHLGPVPTHDPLALLTTATTGAARVPGVSPVAGESLAGVRTALDEVSRHITTDPDVDRPRALAVLNQVAYELTHRVRVQVTDERVTAWLAAGETALDAAVHTPGGRSATSTGLAAWQQALAAVQPVEQAAIVRRSVLLGHVAILRTTAELVREASASGALPAPYAAAVIAQLRQLATAHQTGLARLGDPRLGSTPADQAVMLTVGAATRQVTGRPDAAEPSPVRLDALFRSSFGEAAVVARLTDSAARPAADILTRLALEYVANPALLRSVDPPVAAPAERPATAARESQPAASPGPPVQPTITPGTVLSGPAVVALCRARDLGVAAASGDAVNPPELLRGIDPSHWPQLVVEGRQAVTDLVASVYPMVYAQTRGLPHVEDLRGQMFVELLGAAHRFDAQRISPERWPTYAWVTLEHSRWRGVDAAGAARKRNPRPDPLPLEGREVASRERGPGDVLEERQSAAAISRVLDQLPDTLRDPLFAAMQGRSGRAIGEELGRSESTGYRRVRAAREFVREGLAAVGEDSGRVTGEGVTDPVLARSQRLFEQTFGPLPTSEQGCGPSR